MAQFNGTVFDILNATISINNTHYKGENFYKSLLGNGDTEDDSNNDFFNALMLKIYPVGSYYWSDGTNVSDPDEPSAQNNSGHPSNLFGGTWTRVEGVFLYAAGDYDNTVGHTGGSSQHSHTLTDNAYAQIALGRGNQNELTGNIVATSTIKRLDTGYDRAYIGTLGTKDPGGAQTGLVTPLGGSTELYSSMPPYIVAYCWKRTA